MPIKVVTDQDFESEVLTSELPVLVHIYSEFSKEAKLAEPELEAVAKDLEGRAKVVKVDAEKSARIVTALRLQSLPANLVFQQGRPVAIRPGMLRRKGMLELIDRFLPRAEGAVKPLELAELIKEGSVVPVDTRDARTFGRAHIPGAVNFPQEEIKTRLAELHMLTGAPIFYCRTGKDSKELADELAQDGIQGGFLEGGFLAWEAEQLAIERPD